MTQEGVQLTQEGEIPHPIFSIKRKITLGFSTHGVEEVLFAQRLKMIFVLKGIVKCSVSHPRKKTFSLTEHQHNLILANDENLWEIGGQDPDIICLEIDFSLLSNYLPPDHPGLINLRKGRDKNEVAIFSTQNFHINPEIITILNSLKTSTHSGFCEKLFLESKVLELLMFQVSQFEQLTSAKPLRQLKEEELNKMQEIKTILLDNINTQIPLRTLAHMVGTNEFNLKRNFKIAFGNTVYGYLSNHKMELAKTMLIETNLPVAEIATKLGYTYATHFSSAFKKYFGYLPNKLKSVKLSLLIFAQEFTVLVEGYLSVIKNPL